MSNIFKQFREYQSRNVDSPFYEPLKQGITVWNPEEEKKKKRKEYAKEYYRKNRKRLREQQREYWRRKHIDGVHRGDMIGIQKEVYEYLLDQYRKGEDPARGTEIAKALGVSDNSVYTAVFQLTKKGYLGRGTYGRYLLLKFPDGEGSVEENEFPKNNVKEPEMVYVKEDKYDEVLDENTNLRNENLELKKKVEELEVIASKKSKKHVDGEDYSPGYVGQLKHSIKTGQKIINELKERVVYLEEQLEKVQVVEVKDEDRSDYLKKLEDQNSKLADEVIMLRKIVKYLSRYMD